MQAEQTQMKDFIEDNFFIITPDNLGQVTSRIYGYAWEGDQIYLNSALNSQLSEGADGTFISIASSNGLIKIDQSFFSPGLHYFRHNDWFAISNSFFYLLEYLLGKFPLTFNDDYATWYQANTGAYFQYEETMIKEINTLPKSYLAVIDKAEKRLDFVRKKQRPRLALNSPEGTGLLDAWQIKWSRRIAQMQRGCSVEASLSGGFDSRAALAIFNSPFIDLNSPHIRFASYGGEQHTFKEDLAVATAIAQRYGFRLNIIDPKAEQTNLAPEMAMKISFLCKLGFHSHFNFRNKYVQNTLFRVGGNGGEVLRGYWEEDVQNFVSTKSRYCRMKSLDAADSSRKIIVRSLAGIRRDYGIQDENDGQAVHLLLENGYLQNHFARYSYEHFLYGKVTLTPLIDPDLHSLDPLAGGNRDRNLFMALIYTRYLPEILDIPLDSGKAIAPATMALAKAINEKYPRQAVSAETVGQLTINDQRKALSIPAAGEKTNGAADLLLELFKSKKSSIQGLFGKHVYYEALRRSAEDIWYADAFCTTLLAAAIIKDMLDGKPASRQGIN